MTNNIVVQFASSLWKPSESQRASAKGFNVGDFKEYRVVAGSVFNEEYNETLDSATLVLSQIEKEDRLSNIKPYDYVRVFDKSSFDPLTGKYKFDKLYLVDNFDEKENNIKEHIFGYTINLMSETKILEKIQCPNLTITHDVVNGVSTNKTIYEYISRYMQLFVPKVKMFDSSNSTWNYKPIINLPSNFRTITHTGIITIEFTLDDFQYIGGHGRNYVMGPLYSDPISEEPIDENSVTYTFVIQSQMNHNEISVDFETHNNIFSVYVYDTNNPQPGIVTINYTYETTELTEFGKRFNFPCADLSFNCPTLRQLLTVLMQQVGCIPIVKNRTLGYLDFQKDAISFAEDGDYSLGNTVNFIRRSLSSDSYVNTLVNMSDQVLDSGNEVICETLGFRDRSNVLLKQKENLCLETSLPIYKVNKCILHAPGKYTGYVLSSAGCFAGNNYWGGPVESLNYKWPVIYYFETIIENNIASIKFRIWPYYFSSVVNQSPNFSVNVDKIYFWSRNGNNGYSLVEEREFGEFLLNDNTLTNSDTLTYHDYQYATDRTTTTKSRTKTFSNLDNSVVGFMFSGKFVNLTSGEEKEFTFIRWDKTDSKVDGHDIYMLDYRDPKGQEYDITHPWDESFNWSFVARYDINLLCGFQSWDITKLIVENSARQLLSRDFQTMGAEISSSNATIDKLSKYVYGTVGYSIGSTQITGFSEVFVSGEATGLGWVQYDYTYLENIVKAIEDSAISPLFYVIFDYFEDFGNEDIYRPEGNNIFFTEMDSPRPTNQTRSNGAREAMDYTIANSSFLYYNSGTGEFGDNEAKFFTGFFVDLYYQPLNSFNMSYVKKEEDVALPLAQYDGNASGVTDFDRLSIHEQEQVDRIGNETLSINQRTTNYNQIRTFENGPLVFRDDVNRNGEISESESVDYIIFKRSFTINNNCYNVSYVGSKDAVLKDYFTSIRTKYRAYQYVDYSQSVLRKEKDVLYVRIASDFYDGDDRLQERTSDCLSNFVYDIGNDADNLGYKRNISYEVETDYSKVANGSSGYTYPIQTIKNSVSLVSTDNSFAIIYEYMDNVGAGPYIADITNDANLGGIPQSWQIWYDVYNIAHEVKFTNFIDFYSQTTSFYGSSSSVATQIKQIEQSPIVHEDYPYTTIFAIVDNNKTSNGKRTFYKDYAERINHTIQFIYYAPNKDVLVGEDFISGAPVINRYEHEFNAILCADLEDFTLNKYPYDYVQSGNRRIIDRKEWHQPGGSREDIPFGRGIIYFELNAGYSGIPYFEVFWQTIDFEIIPVIKLCHYDETANKLIDIAVFRCIDPIYNHWEEPFNRYYFMINDTKTDYVFDTKDGILYKKYKVSTTDIEDDPMPDRDVIDLYAEPEEEGE